MLKLFLLKRKMKQYGFQYINVPKTIINKYRRTTNNNKFLTDKQIEWKLNREFYSSSIDSSNEVRDIVNYGFLKIVKDNKRNLIIDIYNSKSNRCGKIKYKVKDLLNSIHVSIYKEEV